MSDGCLLCSRKRTSVEYSGDLVLGGCADPGQSRAERAVTRLRSSQWRRSDTVLLMPVIVGLAALTAPTTAAFATTATALSTASA